MRVVSNTSPLQYLHAIHQLSVLEQLYGRIVVPQAVMAEIDTGRWSGYDVPDCRAYPWLIPDTVAIPAMLRLITNLGAGEAEALALALAAPTDLVLLDDALARQVAASQGIRYTGTLGILIQAKHHGLVAAVMPLVEVMQDAGFRVSDGLKAIIRRMTAE